MSERNSSQTKTEQPTPKRLRDLRKKGQVARSRDVPATAVVVIGLAALFIGGVYLFDGFKLVLQRAAGADFNAFNDRAALTNWTQSMFIAAAFLSAPFALGAALIAGIAGFIQVGPVFSPEQVKPQLQRINPISGLKRLFSLENFVDFIKLVIKLAVLAAVVAIIVWQSLPVLVQAHWLPIGGVLPLANRVLGILAWSAVACFVATTAMDLWFQKWNFIRRNRMTLEEVRREYKEMEGDPHVRAHRRQLHREINTANMLENVRKASVVVVNPTHIAIALYYEAGETDLPIVVAKGEGHIARAIREIAEQERIPILRNVDLARRLRDDAPLNQYIPEEFIEPVAAVLRWAREVKRRAGQPD